MSLEDFCYSNLIKEVLFIFFVIGNWVEEFGFLIDLLNFRIVLIGSYYFES